MTRSGRWWSKTRGMAVPVFDAWVSSMRSEPDRPTKILAWCPAAHCVCILSLGCLSYGNEGGWKHRPWHTIEKGGWNVESQQLSWRIYDGTRDSLQLRKPGKVPQVFRERVASSIAYQRFVALRGDDGVVVSARRDLGRPSAPLGWHLSLGQGLNWETDGVRHAAERALAQVRREYDSGLIG